MAGNYTRIRGTGIRHLPGLAKGVGSGHKWKKPAMASFSGENQLSSLLRFDGLYARAQAGLIATGGVLVQNALLDAFVDDRYGLAIGGLGSRRVALGNGLTQGAKGSAETGLIGAIARCLGFGLTRTLERRKMIRHTFL
jgi:hypothetical protein